jgi:hypothetical protein
MPCLLAVCITALLKPLPLPAPWRFIAALLSYGLGSWAFGIVRKSDADQFARLARDQLSVFRNQPS